MRKHDRVEVTEHGAIYEVLPEVKDSFAPRHLPYGLKRKDCCHALDAGSETRPCESLTFTNKGIKTRPSQYTESYMSCPRDTRGPGRKVVAWSRCPSNYGKEGQHCPYFRRKL